MAHNPYAAPTARLQEAPESRIFFPMLAALLAGVASWLALLKTAQWTYRQHVMPSIEGDILLPAIVVYAAFGVAIALLRAKPWWTSWPAFVMGIVLCILGRHWPFPDGMMVVLGFYRHDAFLTAVVASLTSFVLISRRERSRSNKSLERTREG